MMESWGSDERESQENTDELHRARKILELSNESKVFFDSGLGRFILDRAIEAEDDAKMQLVTIKRADFDSRFKYDAEVERLQNQAHIPALMITWMHEVIQQAREEDIIYHTEEENSDEQDF